MYTIKYAELNHVGRIVANISRKTIMSPTDHTSEGEILDMIDKCSTHKFSAIGITVDVKTGNKNSYVVLKNVKLMVKG